MDTPRADMHQGEPIADANADGSGLRETTRPSLTLAEAAQACRVSLSTVKRMHYAEEGSRFPNAWREPGPSGPGTGAWRIPITDLICADLSPHRPEPISGPAHEQANEPPAISQLEADRDRWKALAEKWEAIADERESALVRLDRSIAALTSGSPPAPAVTKRRWRWGRRN